MMRFVGSSRSVVAQTAQALKLLRDNGSRCTTHDEDDALWRKLSAVPLTVCRRTKLARGLCDRLIWLDFWVRWLNWKMMKPRTRSFAGMPGWATAACAQLRALRCIIAKPCARWNACDRKPEASAAVWSLKARPTRSEMNLMPGVILVRRRS